MDSPDVPGMTPLIHVYEQAADAAHPAAYFLVDGVSTLAHVLADYADTGRSPEQIHLSAKLNAIWMAECCNARISRKPSVVAGD